MHQIVIIIKMYSYEKNLRHLIERLKNPKTINSTQVFNVAEEKNPKTFFAKD